MRVIKRQQLAGKFPGALHASGHPQTHHVGIEVDGPVQVLDYEPGVEKGF